MAVHSTRPSLSRNLPVVIASALIVLCAAGSLAAANSPATPAAVGALNPAALYCIQLGYDYEIIATEDGERGFCRLPSGERVDAWEFFRGKCAEDYSYCAREGYRTQTIDLGSGTYTAECAVCVDKDGTTIGTVAELMGLYDLPAFESLGILAAPAEEAQESADILPAGSSRPREARDLPTYFDWREQNGCTPIKNQGGCGSCWAFSTVAPLECGILIKDGVEEDLSEQYLVSCNSDGWGCGGGWYAHNYHTWKPDPCGDVGPVLDEDFPYAAQDLPCDCPYPHQLQYLIRLWDFVGETGGVPPVDAMKQAILDYGPISVACAVAGTFGSYSGGIFEDCDHTGINHAVALVGWDDSQGPEGIWFMRNSWGPGWGEDGYMRMPYGCVRIGYDACWVDYPGRPALGFSYPDGLPEAIVPNEPTTIRVQIDELYDEYVPGTASLHYRYDGGDFETAPLVPLDRSLFEAVLPPADCSAAPEFYFSADGAATGTQTDPYDAPNVTYRALVGELTVLFADDFESDTGWSVEDDPELTDGSWNRGVPVGGGDRGDPATDYDGSGQCYLTDNVYGNSDVDGGETRLISPVFDLAAYDQVLLSAAVWYTNLAGDNPHDDIFAIRVSENDGADWVTALTIGPQSSFGWSVQRFMIDDYVALTATVRVQFAASDLGSGSIVEAGVDDFALRLLECGFSAADSDEHPTARLMLCPASPNPFSGQTRIDYRLPQRTPVQLRLLAVDGRVVRTLLSGDVRAPGHHSVCWDGCDEKGQRAPAGIYYSRFDALGRSQTQRVILIR